jgi:hypothetical protein
VTELLGDAAEREQILREIEPERAQEHHPLLQRIFRAESERRRETGGDDEYYENLYCCAFLLYHVGDVRDVPMMWEAKQLDFDAAIGFDVQFLLGAGSRATLAYLIANGHPEIARALAEFPELDEDLTRWSTFRRGYFYPAEA